MYKKALLTLVLVIGLIGVSHATIQLPFGPEKTWYVCRGYNVKSHAGAPALDLSIDPNSPVEGGCLDNQQSANASSTPPREVTAPATGTVGSLGRQDMLCLSLDQGGSIGIGHLVPDTKAAIGTRVRAGDYIGVVAAPNTLDPAVNGNGNYAHIHIQAHPVAGCPKGTLVPFNGSMRFEDLPDLPNNGIINQHAGLALTNYSVAQSTWHPAGSLIRATGDTRVYYLQKDEATGKIVRRWVYDVNAFNKMAFKWEDIITVSSQEKECYR